MGGHGSAAIGVGFSAFPPFFALSNGCCSLRFWLARFPALQLFRGLNKEASDVEMMTCVWHPRKPKQKTKKRERQEHTQSSTKIVVGHV
jgi:hypothetical protein